MHPGTKQGLGKGCCQHSHRTRGGNARKYCGDFCNATGFDQVTAFDSYITFNPEVLDTISLESTVINIHPNISNGLFNVINGNTVAFTWSSMNPQTIPDDGKLFDLSFSFCNALFDCAVNGTQSLLEFIEDQTHFTVEFEELPLVYHNGSVYAPDPLGAVTVETEGNGHVMVDGESYVDPIVDQQGTSIHLEALPDQGYDFQHWKEDDQVISTQAVINHVIDADHTTLVAVFDGGEEDPVLNLDIVEGFTWFSINVTQESMYVNDLLAGIQAEEGDRILGQTESAIYTGSEWFENIEMATEARYTFDVSHAQTIEISGAPASNTPIHLYEGFTWLGFLPQQCLPVNSALQGITPEPANGDRILGQTSYAEFFGGQWIGSLDELCPGMGYVIHLQQESVLTYPK